MMKLFAENEALSVRQFSPSDLDDFAMLTSNGKSMKYCPTGKLNRRQAEAMFANILNHAARNKYCLYAIVDKKLNKMIGLVGLQECSVEDDIGLSFVYRTLPEYFANSHINTLFSQLINNLLVIHHLSKMNAVIAKKNLLSVTLMEYLHFKLRSKHVVCRGIDSFLYQYSPQ